MSWSITIKGKPEEVVKGIEAESARLTGQSKVEFDDAKPHMIALLRQTFVADGVAPDVRITASGSGYFDGNKQVRRDCSVKIETHVA